MASIKEVLSPLLTKVMELSEDSPSNDMLVCIESQQRYDALIRFLEHQMTQDEDFKTAAINKVTDFLCDVWLSIKNTKAIYPISPHTRANRACLLLAEEINKHVGGSHPYAFLMFPVEASSPTLTRKNLSEYKLHELMIADDGTVIEVEKCLLNALSNKTLQLQHTHLKLPDYMWGRKLTSDERDRIIHHSKEANELYQAIQKYVIYEDKNYEEKKDAFINAIRSDDYKVLASYGAEGEARLVVNILQHIKSRDAFVDFLTSNVNRIQWKLFLKKVPTSVLTELMLQDECLINVLQRRSCYTGDDLRDRAMLFCLAEVYIRQQELENYSPLFTSWLPEYVNQYVGNYSVTCKQEAGRLLQAFLASHHELTTLEQFVKRNAKRIEHVQALFSILSSLGLFAEQIKAITDPDYFKPRSLFTKMFCY